MQLCVAYTLLRRVLDHAITTRADRFGIVYRLEQFVRRELDAHPKLREQVFAELRRVANGAQSSPSILVPVSAKALESAAGEMGAAANAFKSRAARGKKAIKK
jgi:hypothetical protein